ncbi:MAG TPA: FkbM family methyltransferase [Alphaproteobacteria bacterium]|nr:FkbM family methyltransferase [Alphaproteobacteria bacterium]
MTPPRTPSFRLEERLKYALVPPALYHAYLERKALKRGEPELRLVPFLARSDRISIDAGANKGVYTRWLARFSKHVHAFEPNPKLFRILTRALPGNVSCHAAALAERSGTATLRIPYGPKGFSNQRASLNPNAAKGKVVEIEVETRALDDYGFDDVGFIKIDVEGFELAVLKGARETLRRCRPALLVEIEEAHSGEPLETSLSAIEALGYAGLFLKRGTLRPLSAFEPEADQRSARARGGEADYVFNFIFLPSGGG